MESDGMGSIQEMIKNDLNSSELIEKFKQLGLEKGFNYRSIEFQDVEIEKDKITIKIKTT